MNSRIQEQTHYQPGDGVLRGNAKRACHHHALRAGLEAVGLSFVVEEDYRLPQLNAVTIPDGVDAGAVSRLPVKSDGCL